MIILIFGEIVEVVNVKTRCGYLRVSAEEASCDFGPSRVIAVLSGYMLN